ncbi:MAG: dihydroneopterin aldolase [Deltaproteobacteria bacterium]|nr:dihydroneopterin aldolase [Deltaproteobacteria bacterium]
MILRIKSLRLRTIIGTDDWERKVKQDIVVHIEMDIDAQKACKTDRLKDTVNYKPMTKAIIRHVESSRYFLIEKLASEILKLVMKNRKVLRATVEVEKPFALRFADSVSVKVSSDES